MSSPSAGGYRVLTLRTALDTVNDWLTRAASLGIRPLLEAALLRILDRLTNDPVGWGNPLFTYHHLGMQMYNGVEWDMVVTYGVDVGHRLVCIRQFQLLPMNPLNAPPGGPTP
jgi:hypothetical protein